MNSELAQAVEVGVLMRYMHNESVIAGEQPLQFRNNIGSCAACGFPLLVVGNYDTCHRTGCAGSHNPLPEKLLVCSMIAGVLLPGPCQRRPMALLSRAAYVYRKLQLADAT